MVKSSSLPLKKIPFPTLLQHRHFSSPVSSYIKRSRWTTVELRRKIKMDNWKVFAQLTSLSLVNGSPTPPLPPPPPNQQ
jgi:hypothetical protein